MNPTVSSEVLEKEFYRDEEKFRREFQAEFTDTIQTWIASEVLDPCIVAGRSELPFHPGRIYAAALDPASRRNDFTLAIVHKEPGEKIVVDKVARWSGTTATPLAFVPVLAEVKDILAGYEINSACGDQFYCDAIGQHLRSLGIEYQVLTFNSHTRAGLFSN